MKSSTSIPIILLSCVILFGCQTDKVPDADTAIPEDKQKMYLRKSRPPQQFGFSIIKVEDGIRYSGSGRLHPRHIATKDLLEDGLPVIKVRGKARRYTMKMLLDFSSASSWMEFSKAQKMGVHFMGINDMVIPYRGVRNTGGHNAFAGVLTQIRIDGLFIEDIPFYVRMATGSLGPLARGILKPDIDSVLGYDTLRNFEYIQVNLHNNSITFSTSIPYIPHDDLLMSTAKIVPVRGHGLAVEGAIYGEPTPILLDFAGKFHFVRSDTKVNTTKQVSLGDIVFRQVPTMVLEPHASPPRAGRDMLENYIVTICGPEGIVYFERPPE